MWNLLPLSACFQTSLLFMPTGFFSSFKRLSPSERSEFEIYLTTFFKSRQKEIRAFMFLKDLKQLDEQNLYEHVFGSSPKDGELKPIQNVLSELKKFLLEYLTWNEMRQEPEKGAALTLRLNALRNRGWTEAYVNQVNKSKREQAKPTHKVESMWDVMDKLTVLHHYYYYATDENWTDRVQELTRLLGLSDQFYAISQLKYQCEVVSRGLVLKQSNNNIDAVALMQFVNQLPDQSLLPLRVYSAILEMLTNENEQTFQDLKHILETDLTNKEEQWALLMYLVNFSTRMTNHGRKEYTKIAMDLYQWGLQKELFTLGGFFPVGHFHNIVTIGCRLRAFDKIESLINKYGKLLPLEERESVIVHANALVYFERGNFKQAHEEIKHVDINNIIDSLRIRILLIRIYFELTEHQNNLEYECDNLYQYVGRNKLVGEASKTSARNFVKIMKALIANKSKKVLLKMLDTHQQVFAHPWLSKKINDLK